MVRLVIFINTLTSHKRPDGITIKWLGFAHQIWKHHFSPKLCSQRDASMRKNDCRVTNSEYSSFFMMISSCFYHVHWMSHLGRIFSADLTGLVDILTVGRSSKVKKKLKISAEMDKLLLRSSHRNAFLHLYLEFFSKF